MTRALATSFALFSETVRAMWLPYKVLKTYARLIVAKVTNIFLIILLGFSFT